jgi:hypothetical protein
MFREGAVMEKVSFGPRTQRYLAGMAAVWLLTLSSSVSAQDAVTSFTVTAAEIDARKSMDDFRVKSVEALVKASTPEQVRELLLQHMNDRTKTVADYNNKTVFVEFSSSDGKIYTWLPNTEQVSTGTWKIESSANGELSVCFAADGAADKPLCIPSAFILSEYCTIELRERDVFGLTTGKLPFSKAPLVVPAPAQ